ncbi:MAG: hypothetical protein IRY99_15825 [Isosphaeraceae bacterium]|nr:hypothetical protein [Isosphaeraceae bacterium]
MKYRGRVKGGVIALEEDVELPEGAMVAIELIEERPEDISDNPLYRIAELAVDTGIPDLSRNIDHYLYGHPKVGEADE